MNNRAKVNAKVAPAKVNMYCKVCADSGKPKDVVTSHNVRDATGKNTCPTLDEQQCRYCKKNGHTVKFCKELEEKNKVRTKILSQCEKDIVKTQSLLKPVVAPVATKNGFAALYSDSESGEETEDAEHDDTCCATKGYDKEREFPALNGWRNVTSLLTSVRPPIAPGLTLNFAAALQTPAMNKALPVQTPRLPTREIKSIVLKSKWADAESSDEEDDDDEEEEEECIKPKTQPIQMETSTCAW